MVRAVLNLFIDCGRREGVTLVEDSSRVEVLKDGHDASAIPIVCHTTSVVDVTRSVFQNLRKKDESFKSFKRDKIRKLRV